MSFYDILVSSNCVAQKFRGFVLKRRAVCPGLFVLMMLFSQSLFADIHSAPIVIPAHKIPKVANHPLGLYRVFKTEKDGTAVAIPFQMDELNGYNDFVLPHGPGRNSSTGNGIFDRKDELAFMGNDVGVAKPPSKWPFKKPKIIYELKITNGKKEGAIYIGLYFSAPPPISEKYYVHFDLKKAEIVTSRYHYRFDHKNYLVVRGVDLRHPEGKNEALLHSSTFYLKADFKYFLTFEVNHRDIDSKLEAYKVGPVRSIVRVSFTYQLLRLKIDLGMYTEVSFFSNAVFLPAIMYNPLEADKSLNNGSGFYYGFASVDDPSKVNVNSNMPSYRERSILDFFRSKDKVEDVYWVSAESPNYTLYMEIEPSEQMRKVRNVPMFYKEEVAGEKIKDRNKDKAKPLGQSPVNMAIYFDLTRFQPGEHLVAFRLYFDNLFSKEKLQEFKSLTTWKYSLERK